MRAAATEHDKPLYLSWSRLYRDARRAGLQEWHSREYADRVTAGELELRDGPAGLRRLVSLDCPARFLARIVL